MATRKKAVAKKAKKAEKPVTFHYWYNTDEPSEAVQSGEYASIVDVLRECRAQDDNGIQNGDTLYIYEIKKHVYQVNKPLSYEEIK